MSIISNVRYLCRAPHIILPWIRSLLKCWSRVNLMLEMSLNNWDIWSHQCINLQPYRILEWTGLKSHLWVRRMQTDHLTEGINIQVSERIIKIMEGLLFNYQYPHRIWASQSKRSFMVHLDKRIHPQWTLYNQSNLQRKRTLIAAQTTNWALGRK